MRKKLNGRVLAGLVILSMVLLVACWRRCSPLTIPTSWACPTCAPPRSTPGDQRHWAGYPQRADLRYPHLPAHWRSLGFGGDSSGHSPGDSLRLSRRMDGPDHHAGDQRGHGAALSASDHHSGGLSGCQRVEHHPGHLHHRLDLYGPYHPQPGAQLKALPFIQIERTMGASGPYIMIRHILPNLGEIVFIRAVLSVGSASYRGQPQLSGSGRDRTEELGRHPALCLFPQWNHQRFLIGGMCRPSCASRFPCLGLCC